jgi:hypothetical protein
VIKILIILIAILLYLLVGYNLFSTAINSFGGPQEYVNEIAREDSKVDPWIVYYWSGFLVLLFWPYFLIEGFMNRRK